MSAEPKAFNLSPTIHGYLVAHSEPLGEVEQSLIAATAELGGISIMQIAPEQGVFMGNFAAAIGARRVIEVGTFTGFSTLCMARALPADGVVVACDVSEEWTAVGRTHWQKAGVADRIDLRLGPALDTLRAMPLEPSFDLAFIDADKTSYRDYYEEILLRLRVGGMIMVDNVLWMGAVVDPNVNDPDTAAIRAFNDFVVADSRVAVSMIPVGDGLSLVRKLT